MDNLRLPTDLEIRLAAIHQIHLGEKQTKIEATLVKFSKDLALTNVALCGILLLLGYSHFMLRGRLEKLECQTLAK
jgi:hypothetical protein